MRVVRAFKFEGKVYVPPCRAPKLPKDIREMLVEKGCIEPKARIVVPKKAKKEEVEVPKKTLVTRWNLDPESLKELSLQQLQVLIVERGGGADIPETEEECIAKLSKDFK